jgi:hypothetical protein
MDMSTVDSFRRQARDLRLFRTIADRIDALGPSEVAVASQIGFGLDRKFAYCFWLYNVTKKNPNGVLYMCRPLRRPT